MLLRLQRLPNVIVTPHTAYYTERALHDTVEQTLINCLRLRTEPGRMTDGSTIAILFGGCSEEHDVSVKSAMEIAASIDTQKYEPIYVGITKSRRLEDVRAAAPRRGKTATCRRAVISPDRETHGLLVGEGGECRAVHIDAVFPVLHGKTGEDGAVQGLLELSGIPYVGCDIQSSAICMDKSLAYVVARSAGIDTPEFSVLDGADAAVPDDARVPRVRQAGAFGLVVRRDQGRARRRAGRRASRPHGATTARS